MSGHRTVIMTAKNEGAFLLEWVAYHRLIGFDNIVISSSLDHMMDFRRGLQEAARVLKSKGHIYIAMHEVDDEAENTQLLRRLADISLRTARQVVNGFRTMGLRRTYDYLRQATSLRIPKGAKDLFHVYFPTVEDVTHELFKNGVAVTKTGDCPGFLLLQGQKR